MFSHTTKKTPTQSYAIYELKQALKCPMLIEDRHFRLYYIHMHQFYKYRNLPVNTSTVLVSGYSPKLGCQEKVVLGMTENMETPCTSIEGRTGRALGRAIPADSAAFIPQSNISSTVME